MLKAVPIGIEKIMNVVRAPNFCWSRYLLPFSNKIFWLLEGARVREFWEGGGGNRPFMATCRLFSSVLGNKGARM